MIASEESYRGDYLAYLGKGSIQAVTCYPVHESLAKKRSTST